MAVSRRMGLGLLLGMLLGSEGVRMRRKAAKPKAHAHASKMMIGGVPVFNYDQRPGLSGVHAEESWLVVARRGTTDEELASLCQAVRCRASGHGGHGVPFLEVRASKEALGKRVEGSAGRLAFIEPDLIVSVVPEIQEASSADTDSLWGLERIAASKRPSEGQGVHIYVLDTGVRTSHQEFDGRAVPTLDVSTGNGAGECGADVTCARDMQGHGTHCAGTAAGSSFGVAPKATVHAVKVLDDNGSGSLSWSCIALDWLAINAQRPAVASMSLGAGGRHNTFFEAVEAASAAGVVVVVAAGNSNDDACDYSPAYVPSAITVGSTTVSDTRSTFSNFGRCVDFWAPGSNIRSAGHTSDEEATVKSGTSMACPHVSGAAALLLEADGELSPQQVLQAMLDNAAANSIEGLFGDDVNMLLYVGADGPPPTPAPTPAPPSACPDLSSGPDWWGDCECDPGYECWWGDHGGCPYVSTPSTGWYHRFYFLPSCETCQCWPLNR